MKNFNAVESMVNNAMANVEVTNRFAKVGSYAVDVAKSKFNPRSMDYYTLQRGDIIHFPNTIREMENQLIAVGRSVQLMCVVERGGVSFTLAISPSILCRFGVLADGTHVFSKGLISQDFRRGRSMYDAFAQFVGKSARVTNVDKFEIRALKRGAIADTDGRFHEADFCFMAKSFYSMEYVD